ncbi:MAG: cytochrome c peroxidase, partial [Bacteroidota bacterium]
GNNKRTCASCHKPQKAFSDGRITSQGYKLTENLDRNAPSLLNGTFTNRYGHGLEKKDLVTQINFVLHSPHEMNTKMDNITQKLMTIPIYQQLFATAFPATTTIDSSSVIEAIAAYCQTLITDNRPFDQMMRRERITDTIVARGFNLFMGKAKCGTCHLAPIFNGYDIFAKKDVFQPSHLPKVKDLGVGNFDATYSKYFKVPSLTNLPETAPYFHDGQVVNQTEIFPVVLAPSEKEIFHQENLTSSEKVAIVQFITSLNSNPFYDLEETIELPASSNAVFNRRKAGGKY